MAVHVHVATCRYALANDGLCTGDPMTLMFSVFADVGVALDKPIVTMCNSGMSSCSLLLAARLAGSQQNAVYHVCIRVRVYV